MNDEPNEIRIDTPDGEVVAYNTPVEPSPQTIEVITGDELEWLESLHEDGPEFVRAYLPDVIEPELKDYDAAFRAWQLDDLHEYSDDDVIEIIGGYLGHKCVKDFDFEWVSVTDDYGTDYSVRSKEVELMSFPFSTVQKRIEDGDYEFVYGVYYTIKEMLTKGDYKVRQEPTE